MIPPLRDHPAFVYIVFEDVPIWSFVPCLFIENPHLMIISAFMDMFAACQKFLHFHKTFGLFIAHIKIIIL
jgi:hypothetical protein